MYRSHFEILLLYIKFIELFVWSVYACISGFVIGMLLSQSIQYDMICLSFGYADLCNGLIHIRQDQTNLPLDIS